MYSMLCCSALVAQTRTMGQRIEDRPLLRRWDPMPSSGDKRLLSV